MGGGHQGQRQAPGHFGGIQQLPPPGAGVQGPGERRLLCHHGERGLYPGRDRKVHRDRVRRGEIHHCGQKAGNLGGERRPHAQDRGRLRV